MKRFLSLLIISLVLFLSLSHFAYASEILIELKSIRFEKAPDGRETVFFELNDFYTPEVSTLEEEIPRLVLDFSDVRTSESLQKQTEVNGDFIQRIRVGIHSSKVRVVLDLVPNKNYYVRQKFFIKESIFALIVGAQ